RAIDAATGPEVRFVLVALVVEILLVNAAQAEQPRYHSVSHRDRELERSAPVLAAVVGQGPGSLVPRIERVDCAGGVDGIVVQPCSKVDNRDHRRAAE